MALVLVWFFAGLALLGLAVAWGATIDDAARSIIAGSRRPARGTPRRIASTTTH